VTFKIKVYDNTIPGQTRWGIWDENNGGWVQLTGLYSSSDRTEIERQYESISMEDEAASIGKQYGRNAGAWAIEPGRLSREQMLQMLQGIRDVDPLVMNAFREPDLSGEFRDAPSPVSLAQELGIDPEQDELLSAACQAWEEAAHEAYWAEIERILILQTKED
jgi:hypothetical protein